jgi:Cu(I)/Ag(I) efflux system membrane fusion protein
MTRAARTIVGVVVAVAAAFGGWLAHDFVDSSSWGEAEERSEHAKTAAEDAAGGHSGHAGHAAPAEVDEPRVAIDVEPGKQAGIGVRVVPVTRRPVHHTIRAVGLVTADERLEAHVHTRISGYVEHLLVDAVGDEVERGQALYTLYSPEVFATEYEYAAAAGRGELSAMLAKAALERLELWDVPAAEIQRLKKSRKPRRTITFTSPVRGFVLDKTVLRGMYVMPEMELYHLADLSTVWVIVTLYEHELPIVALGDPVLIALAGLAERTIEGTVSYIYPQVELATRTAKARVELANEGFSLKPGMYAQVTLEKDLGEALLVPEDAVIETGVRQLVFVRMGEARFEPRQVELGPRVSEGRVIRSGLQQGEDVVVRASFLIDAESRLQAAIGRGEVGDHGGHGGG